MGFSIYLPSGINLSNPSEVVGMLSFSLALAGLMLIERRGKKEPLDPNRQIEIHTLLESMPESVVVIDTNRRVVDANSAAAKLSGIPREQLIGAAVEDVTRRLYREPSGNVVQFQRPVMTRVLAGERVGAERRRIQHVETGQDVELLVSATPIRNEKGEIQGALMIARDVTELAQLQQRLADIDRHQAIGHVAAGIAHDFNNTLQTIGQAATVLQMSPDRSAEERKVFLDMIQNAVRRGAEVIARIRDYLRTGTAATTDVDVRSVLDETIELTRPMLQSSHHIELEREIRSTGQVRGNRADLLRVFTNLIINAIQAMPGGGKLFVGAEDEGTTVHVWIRDTGQGIPAAVKKQVFNPYFTTKEGGTGLGLSGAQKILLEIGGNISFNSEEGKGTQFDIRLPKADIVKERKVA